MRLLTLIGYEYKKLFKKKSFVICSILVIPFILVMSGLMVTGNVYVEDEFAHTTYEYIKLEQEIGKKMEGTPITEERLMQSVKNYEKKETEELTADNALEISRKYMKDRLLTNLLTQSDLQNLDEAKGIPFYEQRQEKMKSQWEADGLNDGQISYLTEQMEKTSEPWKYAYNDAYQRYTSLQMSTILVLSIFFVICLAPIFSEEYTTKVDALLLSARYGRKLTFAAKILTGCSFVFLMSVTAFLTTWIEQAIFYGTGDASAPMQLMWNQRNSPFSFTSGEVVVLVFVLSIIAALFFSIIIMFLSACMRTAFGPAIIGLILSFLPMFSNIIPDSWHLLSIIRNLIPGCVGDYMFNINILQFGSISIPVYQYAPAIYAVLTIVFIYLAGRRYLRRQPA